LDLTGSRFSVEGLTDNHSVQFPVWFKSTLGTSCIYSYSFFYRINVDYAVQSV